MDKITQSMIAKKMHMSQSEVSIALTMFDAMPVGTKGRAMLYDPVDVKNALVQYFDRKIMLAERSIANKKAEMMHRIEMANSLCK